VFHAARQDLEIFFVEGNCFPKPLFDTQIAAMVCGFGEQVGYETLVKRSHKSRWTRPRALPTGRAARCRAQKEYALADVTHLRVIYESLVGAVRQDRPPAMGGGGTGDPDRPRDLHDPPR
jgi:ribonuclease D